MIFNRKNKNKSLLLALFIKTSFFLLIFLYLINPSLARNPQHLQKVELVGDDFKKTHIAKFKDWSVHKIKT